MTDIYQDGKGGFIVNLGDKKPQVIKDRAKLSQYSGVDLASGFPKEQIWTTKDGRKIAVPNMTDSHLLNTIDYLRRRAKKYKNQILAQFLLNGIAHLSMFDHVPDDVIEGASDEWAKEADKLSKKPIEEFVGKVWPIYNIMYREAYKRKLIVKQAIKHNGSKEDILDSLEIDPNSEAVVRQPKPKKPRKPKKTPSLVEQMRDLIKIADDCEGMEVHQLQWEVAEEIVKKYPNKYSLGAPRGPDRAWKRLNIVGKEN